MIAKGLNDLQKKAADLILMGWSITETANYLEVSRVSVHEWKKKPEWDAYIREQTGESLNARNHRVQRTIDLALAQIQAALVDPEIAPLKRAELAIKWLTLIKESVTQAAAATPAPPARAISLETLKLIREQVYGIYTDPKLPNTPVETSD